MVGICQDKDVGIVGTKLYNKSNLVEHSGIILGMNGVGDFLYKGVFKNAGTYMQRLLIIYNVSCVYYKYALIDKKAFEKVQGFSTEYLGILNSIDFSLKLLDENMQVVINPIISFCVDKLSDSSQDKEQVKPFMDKWSNYYSKGDRYFSPNLSKKYTSIAVNLDEE